MADPKITIIIKGNSADAEKAATRLKKKFEEIGDATDKSLKSANKNIAGTISKAFASGGEREYFETIRRLQPELKQLQNNLKNGSLSQEDYNRRLQMLSPITQKAISDGNVLGKSIKALGDEAEHGANGFQAMMLKADLAGRLISATTQKISESWQTYIQFGREISNISTIVDDSASVNKLKTGLLGLDAQLGSTTDLARGMYQALSSDIEAKDALDFITASAKAARAGLATTFETVDAGTTIMAAYGIEAKNVTLIYDKMFQVAKDGKAEMPQLAQSIGQVASIASLAGISVDELFAAIATASLTNKPSIAIEGLRTALSNIIKPSQQATDLAESLGLQFDSTSLKTKGLAGFLQEVSEKTGNSADKLNILFGDVQGFNIIASLAGNNADKFAERLKNMGNAAGNIETAFARQQESLGAQFDAFLNRIERGFLQGFTKIEPLLKGILSVINTLLPVIITLTIAAVGLKLAWMLLNTQFFTTAGAAIPATLTALKTLWATMTSVTLATSSMGAALAAAMGWLTAIGAVIGLVAYALYQYNSVVKKTAEEHQKSIDVIQGQIDTLGQQQTALNAVSANTNEFAVKQNELSGIYATLNSTSKSRVDSLTNEKGATQALREEIEKLKAAKQDELSAQLVSLLNDTAVAFSKKQQAEQSAADAERIYRDIIQSQTIVSEIITNTGNTIRTTHKATSEDLERLRERWLQAEDASKSANTTFNQNTEVLKNGASIRGMTIQQILEYSQNTNQAIGFSDQFRQSIVSVDNAQQNVANSFNNTTNAIANQTEEVTKLRNELKRLSGVNQEVIDKNTLNIVINAKNRTEAAQQTREALKNNGELRKAVKENKRLQETQKGVTDVISPTSGGGRTRTSRGTSDAAKRLAESQLRAFNKSLRAIDPAMRQMIEDFAEKYKIPIQLALAQIWSESRFKPNARSSDGALGLTQGMPGTFSQQRFGGFTAEQIKNPKNALTFWGKYMTFLFDRFGDWDLAVLAYHQGEGTVDKLVKAMNGGRNGKGIIGKKGRAYLAQIQNLAGVSGNQRFEYVKTEEERNAERILELRLRIQTLQKSGLKDIKIQQEIQTTGLELELRETQEILKLRQKLNYEISAEMPKTAEQRKDVLRVLQEFDKRKEQIESAFLSIAETMQNFGIEPVFSSIPAMNPQDAKIFVEQWTAIEKAVTDFSAQATAARQRIAEIAAGFDDGLTPLEKFEAQVRLLRDSGKFTAGQFNQILLPVINKTREDLEKAARSEWAQKLRQDAKSVADALKSLTDGFQKQFVELTTGKSPLDNVLRSIEDIRELGIGAGALDKVKNLFTVGDKIDVDKFAQYIRYWLMLRSVFNDFDASKIDGIIEKLKTAVGRFNDVADAQRNVDFNNFKQDLLSQLDEVRRNNRELSVYEETLRRIETDYTNLDPIQKENLLNIAAEIDAVRELNRQHAELKDFFKETLKYAFEGDFKGLFENFANRIKDNFIDKLSGWLATNILGFDPNETNNPVAKPIVSKINDSNKLLRQIAINTGGVGIGTGLGIGGGGLNLGSIFGNIGGSGGSGSPAGGSNGSPAGGGIWSNLKQLFSTGPGGIFAPREKVGGGTSKMGGILGGIGDIASVVGGMIGGRIGNVISMAGTGMSIGAMFGPWGAVIGAGAGALLGFLMGDPKRRQDKKENMPKLQQGFADAFKEFQQLIDDVRFLRVDPDGALSKGRELRSQIASGFGIQFLSKKYRKESQKQIAAKLAEIDRVPDGMMEQLKKSVEIAKGSADRAKRILPEFANGVYFADYFKPNGLIPGIFDGKDDLLALLSRGEMVLNSRQQSAIRANAGFDVFASAGIPNYPSVNPSPKLATGGIAGGSFMIKQESPNITVQPNFTLELYGAAIDDKVEAYLTSDGGIRTQIKVQNKLRKSGDI